MTVKETLDPREQSGEERAQENSRELSPKFKGQTVLAKRVEICFERPQGGRLKIMGRCFKKMDFSSVSERLEKHTLTRAGELAGPRNGCLRV